VPNEFLIIIVQRERGNPSRIFLLKSECNFSSALVHLSTSEDRQMNVSQLI